MCLEVFEKKIVDSYFRIHISYFQPCITIISNMQLKATLETLKFQFTNSDALNVVLIFMQTSKFFIELKLIFHSLRNFGFD